MRCTFDFYPAQGSCPPLLALLKRVAEDNVGWLMEVSPGPVCVLAKGS